MHMVAREASLKVIMVKIIVQIINIVKALHSLSLTDTMSMVNGNGNYNAVVITKVIEVKALKMNSTR